MVNNFLEINDQPISLAKALSYLQDSGDLDLFLLKIIRQHIIEVNVEVLKISGEYYVDDALIEQAIGEFILNNNIDKSSGNLEKWLNSQETNYDKFRELIIKKIRIERLKASVSKDKLKSIVDNDLHLLCQIDLSRIVVDTEDLASGLLHKIESQEASFESIAQHYSLTSDKLAGGQIEEMRLGEVPEPIRSFVLSAQSGKLIGPLEIENRYVLIRVNQITPAVLDEKLILELQEEIFDQWLQEQAESLPIIMNAK